MEPVTTAEAAVQRQLDGELRLVQQAILMVASHATPRVLVAGLRLGEAILDPARRMALESGVRVFPAWTADEQHLDIRVEGLHP
jgi:hypothetical protein